MKTIPTISPNPDCEYISPMEVFTSTYCDGEEVIVMRYEGDDDNPIALTLSSAKRLRAELDDFIASSELTRDCSNLVN